MTNLNMDCSNLEDEIDKINATDLFTPNEILDAIQMYDATVEVIGYVDSLESPRIVGNKQQYNFFKFYLNNNNGRRIQVVAWNDEINKILPHIVPNHIIHLDGAQARVPKITNFNNGNVPYELLIRSNTIITNLGKYEFQNSKRNDLISVKLQDISNTSERIILEAYIKTNFVNIHDNKLNKIIGCGSLTDGTYKLEAHIINFDQEQYSKLKLNKGDKISIIGMLQKTANPMYLEINNLSDIQKLDGQMPFLLLLKGTQQPPKRKNDENYSEKISKKKMSL